METTVNSMFEVFKPIVDEEKRIIPPKRPMHTKNEFESVNSGSLKVADLAEDAGCSVWTIHRAIKQGKLKAYLFNKSYYINRNDANEFLTHYSKFSRGVQSIGDRAQSSVIRGIEYKTPMIIGNNRIYSIRDLSLLFSIPQEEIIKYIDNKDLKATKYEGEWIVVHDDLEDFAYLLNSCGVININSPTVNTTSLNIVSRNFRPKTRYIKSGVLNAVKQGKGLLYSIRSVLNFLKMLATTKINSNLKGRKKAYENAIDASSSEQLDLTDIRVSEPIKEEVKSEPVIEKKEITVRDVMIVPKEEDELEHRNSRKVKRIRLLQQKAELEIKKANLNKQIIDLELEIAKLS